MSRRILKDHLWDFHPGSNAQERDSGILGDPSPASTSYGREESLLSSQTGHHSEDLDAMLLENYPRLPKDAKFGSQSGRVAESHVITSAYGEPAELNIISWKEILCLTTCVIAGITAITTVVAESLAVRLGQTKQLVILGFCISIMGYFTRKSLQCLLISVESSKGATAEAPTTLQNLDAISSCNPAADSIGWQYRPILIVLLLGPIALGAAYKTFSDGESSLDTGTESINFGLTGPPGTQHIGFGLSQFVNVTSNWFSDPGSNRTYGFNMFVSDYNTTAMLDGPVPSNVTSMQRTLADGDFIDITAKVNATLLHNQTWFDESFNPARLSDYADLIAYQKFVYNTSFWYGIMLNSSELYSTVWVSWWTDLWGDQSFGSEVRQYSLYRQMMQGKWRIKSGSISLLEAASIKGSRPNLDGLGVHLAIPALFASALTEYDYKFVKYSPSRYQNISNYQRNILNDATSLAAVVWARLTALKGVEVRDPDDKGIMPIYPVEASIESTRRTLRQRWGLYILIILQPAVMLIAIAIRLAFYMKSPVSEEFGLITLLAASEPSTLGVLKGAGYSGKLRMKIPVKFCSSVEQDVVEGNEMRSDDTVKISMSLGQGGENAKVYRGVKYE